MKSTYNDSRLILQGVVGSRAYGTDHAESDTDRLGVWMASNSEVLGLTDISQSYHFTDPSDLHVHELGRYVSLAMKCNPTVIELLWLDDWETMTVLGQSLVYKRNNFLSVDGIMKSYGGYATAQFKRQKGMEPSDSKLKMRKHCLRLLYQAIDLLDTGSLTVKLTDWQKCSMETKAGKGYSEEVQRLIDTLKVSADKSNLPDVVDVAGMDAWLVWARLQSINRAEIHPT